SVRYYVQSPVTLFQILGGGGKLPFVRDVYENMITADLLCQRGERLSLTACNNDSGALAGVPARNFRAHVARMPRSDDQSDLICELCHGMTSNPITAAY